MRFSSLTSQKVARMDGQYAGLADPHRIGASASRAKPRCKEATRAVWAYPRVQAPALFHIGRCRICAQPVDDAACLHASVTAVCPQFRITAASGFIWNSRIIRQIAASARPEILQSFAGQPCFLRERQQLKLCFIHAGPSKLPLLRVDPQADDLQGRPCES